MELRDEASIVATFAWAPRVTSLIVCSCSILLLVLVVGVAYAQVDDVARARGIVRPGEDVVAVQARAAGRIAAVFFAEGDTVDAGAVIMRYETADLLVSLRGLQAQRDHLAASVEQLTEKRDALARFCELERARSALAVEIARGARDESARKVEAERAAAEDERERAEREVEFARRLFEAKARLFASSLISRSELDEIRLRVDNAELNLRAATRRAVAQSGQVVMAQAELSREETADAALLADQTRRLKEIDVELAAGGRALEDLNLQIVLAEMSIEDAEIRTPRGGVVCALSVRTGGDVVEVGSDLFAIAPDGAARRAEIQIPEKNVGAVREGQVVRCSFDSYPSSTYGTAAGRVVRIAPDSRTDDGEVVYHAWVSLDESELQGSGERVGEIKIGMIVEVEIVTGQRSVLSMLFESGAR
jgi:adhesin transport system membrane fusion protein